MKRNKYVCVATSVNPNQATSYNDFAESMRDNLEFDKLIQQLKRSITEERKKKLKK